MEITFEKLPQAVNQLFDKIENIERLLLEKSNESQPEADQLLTIQQASEIIHLSVPTIYGLVQRFEIPVCKRRKRLYFSKRELTKWIMDGRKKTVSAIATEAEIYLSTRPRSGKYRK